MPRLSAVTLVLSFVFTSGCIFDSDEDKYLPWTVSVDSVSVRFVEGRTVFFAVYGWVPDPCVEFYKFDLKKTSNDYYISIETRREMVHICPAVISTLVSPVYFEVEAPGTYSFHFWQSDTSTVDTTFAIQ